MNGRCSKAASLLLLGVLPLAAACTRGPESPRPAEDLSARKVRVVATIGMIADVAEQVGGERVEATGLMGPGIDPHLYKASEGDVARMAGADVIFYNGLHLEGKMAEVFERMGKRIRTVAVTDGIDRALLMKPQDYPGVYDPHVWFDVTLWMKAVERIAETLAEIDPKHAAGYRGRGKEYLARLAELDDYVKRRAGELPPERRVLVTAHDAFHYFGRAYGFEVRGLQGVSTVAEAGTADIQALAATIAERRIPAVFVETSVPPRTIEALKEAVRARGFRVETGGDLFSDAMGAKGTPEGTYVGMVRHNIDTIVSALKR